MIEQGCPACVPYVKVHIARSRVATLHQLLLVDFHLKKAQNESKKVDSPRSVFNSNLQPQRVSAQFFNYILSHLARTEVWVNMKLVTL